MADAPTFEQIASAWIVGRAMGGYASMDDARAEFDRAVAEHDREMREAERERCARIAEDAMGPMYSGKQARDIALRIRQVPDDVAPGGAS